MRPGHAEVPAVILINLLPHREAARKRRREVFYASLGASALAGCLIAGTVYLWYVAQISDQRDQNVVLQTEITRLEGQIKDIATLQAEIAALRARQQAVEDLQADRNMPVHLLNELVKQLPDGVYVTSLKQENQVISLQGMAQSNERVSELLRNLGNNSPWLSRPELVEITAANVALSPRDQRRVSNFTMKVRLLRASEAQKAAAAAAAAGASAPLPAASSPTAAASAPART
jgi:type IV pilus assembly protein PilN